MTVAAPPTIGETIDVLDTKYGVELPLLDIFYWGQDPEAIARIKAAMRVGTSTIDDRKADHYAFREDDIDWQIWIAQGEAPLPLRYVITTKTEPGEPQYTANLNWNTAVETKDADFSFTPTKDDHPIAIVDLEDTQTTP